MMNSYASNATLSKALSMYGKRLTAKEYSDLIGCRNVGEIASYLKHRTYYGAVLKEINENEIHRGQLESILRRKLFFDFSGLARYELSVGEKFYEYIISMTEIDQIMRILALMSSGNSIEYIYSMPVFFDKHTHIDLQSFSKIKDYNDLLNSTSKSEYYRILKSLAPHEGEQINLTKIETALYTHLYNKVFDVIENHTGGKAQYELKDIFNSYVDFTNFVRILRLKKYYSVSPEYIKECLLPFGNLKKYQIDKMIECDDINEIFSIMKQTSSGKKINNIEFTYPDEIPTKIKFSMCKHYIRFSVHPSVVMISYMFLSQIELANIITIIEGIRYQLPADEIRKMIVYTN